MDWLIHNILLDSRTSYELPNPKCPQTFQLIMDGVIQQSA